MLLTGLEVLERAKRLGRPYEDIPVPSLGKDENGNDVKIRVMAPVLGGMDSLQARMAKQRHPQEGYKANLLITCCTNPDGSEMFSPEQFDELNTELAATIFFPVIPVAERLCGFNQQNVELIKKNSMSNQSGDSD